MNYLMNFRNSCDHEWIAGEDVTKDGSNQIKTYRKPSLFGGMNIHLQGILWSSPEYQGLDHEPQAYFPVWKLKSDMVVAAQLRVEGWYSISTYPQLLQILLAISI